MSEIKVDTLTGKTTAKTVTVTVGATATQSLEQGVAKAWAWVDHQTDNVIDQSFNTSGFLDEGAGLSRVTVTNEFANAQPVTVITTYRSAVPGGTGNSGASTYNSSDLRIFTGNSSASATDAEYGIVAYGDVL